MAAAVEQREALTMGEVLAMMRERCPEAMENAYVVGKWIWAEFPSRPSDHVRGELKSMGFHWNRKRGLWQNRCGMYRSRQSRGDPRDRYGKVAASRVALAPATFEDGGGDQWG